MVSDWLAHEVVAVDLDGHREVILEVPSMPFSFDWLPDGRLLVLSNGDGRRLQRREPDGSLVTQAELTSLVADGDLSNRRVWAEVDGYPDGICLDADNAVWCAAMVRCVRVAEGGRELQAIELDRSCFACMLGGPEHRTLFMMAAEWRGPEGMTAQARTGQVIAAAAPAPRAGWP